MKSCNHILSLFSMPPVCDLCGCDLRGIIKENKKDSRKLKHSLLKRIIINPINKKDRRALII